MSPDETIEAHPHLDLAGRRALFLNGYRESP